MRRPPPVVSCAAAEHAREAGRIRHPVQEEFATLSEQDAAPEDTGSLGHMFRVARVSQGMTLEQMATATHIQEDALRALEEDCFDRLPPLVFAKGSARSYARALNLDEEHCMRLFAECSMSFYNNTGKDQPLVFPKIQVENGRRSKSWRYVVVGAVVVLLLLFLRVSPPSSDPLTPATPPVSSSSPPESAAPERSTPVRAAESGERH